MTSSLEARLDALERDIRINRDERAIEELMSRIHFFALDEPDVSFEVGDRGIFKGKDAITSLFVSQYGAAVLKGNLLVQLVTTGSVQVAGDGKTAKGMWRCLHLESVMPADGNGEPDPIWASGAYAVDFIRKGTEWKIWHLHWFRTIKCSHYDGWVRDKKWQFPGALPNSPEIGATTYHNPYTPDSVQDSIPPCPLPYEKYDGQEWMVTDQADLWKKYSQSI
ncbi:uncharacterized protein N7484_000774 [Penicillium longicatenatum]|uniref:uncharacterized protein n=1 Tax=Penicillium longicatenatum TaxID=1561947 RepID=UPI002546E651|nr:uncharacterized protein N7484_000774 [Penicillium longicatenatum]KAJ5657125.1 hypothetical protein N7484_000774 [Penicillium longicatenatum]